MRLQQILIGIVLIAAAVGLGLWLGVSDQRAAYRAERAAMNLEMARTMRPFQIAFRLLLGLVTLATLGGLGWGAVRWLNSRADTVYPDRSGLYPIREGRVGRSVVFHDPNRTLTGSTVYATGEQRITVQHALPGGRIDVQQQVTGQAQAAQALRASVSGSAALPSGRTAPRDLFERSALSRPLPEVKELDLEPSHIERLLLEDGDVEQGGR
jgi:hypothetical protein